MPRTSKNLVENAALRKRFITQSLKGGKHQDLNMYFDTLESITKNKHYKSMYDMDVKHYNKEVKRMAGGGPITTIKRWLANKKEKKQFEQNKNAYATEKKKERNRNKIRQGWQNKNTEQTQTKEQWRLSNAHRAKTPRATVRRNVHPNNIRNPIINHQQASPFASSYPQPQHFPSSSTQDPLYISNSRRSSSFIDPSSQYGSPQQFRNPLQYGQPSL